MWRAKDGGAVLTVSVVLTICLCCVSARDISVSEEDEEKDPGERWAPQEIRIDDMLRKHFLKSRMKNSYPSRGSSEHALRDAEEMEDVGSQYGRHVAAKRAYYNSMRSEILDLAKSRLTRQHEKRPAEMHPLEVGMGKSTSSMAWDTLAGILADEYTRPEHSQPKHELRFIGK